MNLDNFITWYGIQLMNNALTDHPPSIFDEYKNDSPKVDLKDLKTLSKFISHSYKKYHKRYYCKYTFSILLKDCIAYCVYFMLFAFGIFYLTYHRAKEYLHSIFQLQTLSDTSNSVIESVIQGTTEYQSTGEFRDRNGNLIYKDDKWYNDSGTADEKPNAGELNENESKLITKST